MTHKNILLSATTILIIGLGVNEFKNTPIKERGITITQNNNHQRIPKSIQHGSLCLLISNRKRWDLLMFKKRAWKRTKRIVKDSKTGKKTIINTKQSIVLQKIVLNPA